MVDRLEGADPPALTALATALSRTGPAATTSAPATAATATAVPVAAPAAAAAPSGVFGRIKYLLATWPMVLFMKGCAETPRCGFSGRVVEALTKLGVGP